MNEILWFWLAWLSGLLGGIACGWTFALWHIRSSAQRAAKRIVAQCVAAWLPSDVTLRETLDGAPDVVRLGKSDLPPSFFKQKIGQH